jgi:hypothetical protein
MALQKTITLENGVELAEAYIRINSVLMSNGTDISVLPFINLSIYKDATARQDGVDPVVTKTIPVEMAVYMEYFGSDVLDQSGVNPIVKGYEFLKVTTDFSDSLNV